MFNDEICLLPYIHSLSPVPWEEITPGRELEKQPLRLGLLLPDVSLSFSFKLDNAADSTALSGKLLGIVSVSVGILLTQNEEK